MMYHHLGTRVAFVAMLAAHTAHSAPAPQPDATDMTPTAAVASSTSSSSCVASGGTSCSTLSSMSTGKLIAYAFGGMAVVAVVGAAIVFGLKTAQKKKQVANGQHSEAPLRRKAAGRRDSVSDESEDDSDSEASEPSPKQRVGPRKGSAASSGHSRKGSTASAGYPADRKASRSASHSRRPSEGLSKGIEPPPSTHHEPPKGQVVRQHSRKTSREVAPSDTDVSEDDYVEPIAPGKRSGGHERKRSEERRPSEVKRATRV